MTTDTRDALLNAVLAELNSLREHAEASDVCNYGTLSTTFVREHCDRIEAALRTPRPESDARDAVPPDFIKSLHAFADAQYVRALDDLRRDPCLGWEHKVKTGKFGKEEFDAHATANKLLGAYCGIYNAVRAALAALTQPEAK